MAEISSTAIWIRLPEFPVEDYDEEVLFEVGRLIGKPLRLDINTSLATRTKFARMCVEVDLRKPLVSKGRKMIQVLEDKGIHVICFQCGKVGHKMGECTIKARPSDTTTQPSQPAPPASGVARGISDEAEYGNCA